MLFRNHRTGNFIVLAIIRTCCPVLPSVLTLFEDSAILEPRCSSLGESMHVSAFIQT